MMNELELKNAYRVSEDNVPVNNELKQRLITMAKAYDFAENDEPSIKVISSNPNNIERKRIRRRIIKYAAFAACIAVCAVSVTQISKYMDSDEVYPGPPGITTPVPDNGKGHEGIVNDTAGTGQNNNTAGNRQNAVANSGQSGDSGTGRSAGINPTAGMGMSYSASSSATGAEGSYRPSGQTDNIPVQSGLGTVNNGSGTGAEENPPAASEPGKGTEPGKDIESDKKESNTHDEFNSMFETLSGQRSKLTAWDNEIRPLKDADEFISMYYTSFFTSMERYISEADMFESKYSSASDENAYSEAIREYDRNLSEDSEIYSDCRSAYRKAVNYIEMNDMAATAFEQGDESEPEQETTETEPEEHEAEPEGAEDEA